MQEEKQNLPIEVLSAIPQKEKLLWHDINTQFGRTTKKKSERKKT
jgi:hypothetical protein